LLQAFGLFGVKVLKLGLQFVFNKVAVGLKVGPGGFGIRTALHGFIEDNSIVVKIIEDKDMFVVHVFAGGVDVGLQIWLTWYLGIDGSHVLLLVEENLLWLQLIVIDACRLGLR
jgi:hypothetical protein